MSTKIEQQARKEAEAAYLEKKLHRPPHMHGPTLSSEELFKHWNTALPGPWEIIHRSDELPGSITSKRFGIVTRWNGLSSYNPYAMKAHAILIAALPDLVEELLRFRIAKTRAVSIDRMVEAIKDWVKASGEIDHTILTALLPEERSAGMTKYEADLRARLEALVKE